MGEYVDRAWCGRKHVERDRLLADVRRGAVDIVLAPRLAELAESLREAIHLLDDLAVRGVDVIAGALDTTAPLTVGALAAELVRLERDLASARSRSVIADSRRRGVRIGRPRVQIDVAEARRRLAAPGASLRKVARALGVGASTLLRAVRAADIAAPPVRAVAAGNHEEAA